MFKFKQAPLPSTTKVSMRTIWCTSSDVSDINVGEII